MKVNIGMLVVGLALVSTGGAAGSPEASKSIGDSVRQALTGGESGLCLRPDKHGAL